MRDKRKLKKKGFTLIEVAAVIGIIMALMVFFVPRVAAYVNDSKLAGAMAQAKQVVFAWETVNSRSSGILPESTTVKTLKDKGNEAKFQEYFDLTSIKNISDATTVETCLKIVNGDTFQIGEDGFVALNPAKPSGS